MTSSLTTSSPTSTTATNQHDYSASPDGQVQPVMNRVCRYYSSAGFCRAGNDCPFLHDDTRLPGARAPTSTKSTLPEMSQASGSGETTTQHQMIQDRRQAVTKPVPASRVVSKPVPQAATQDPREFQLGQIRRRFSPKESQLAGSELWDIEAGTTLLQFKITPSDPDFPFEMTALECALSVPPGYPKSGPSLRVGNKDIPRGFALNVESGFHGLVKDKPEATLLELMKALDKNLEIFLSAPKAETVKIVPNKDTRHLAALPSRLVEQSVSSRRDENANLGSQINVQETINSVKPSQIFTAQQKVEAVKRRETEIRQLEARMGRLPLYKKSGDGIAYTIPIEPRKRADLPITIQSIKTVQLFVPLLYPLQPCRVQLEAGNPADRKAVERGFDLMVLERKEVTLMVHVNYLAQNMHLLAKTVLELEATAPIVTEPSELSEKSMTKGKDIEGQQDGERSHIQYITRPPEWTIIDPDDVSGTDSGSEDGYSYDSGDESSDENGGVEVKAEDPQLPIQNQERGTAISFPLIELYGIELLEVATLNLTVKCQRCKEIMEVKGLKNGVTKPESCKKCASAFGVGYRRDLIHANAVRAGFLDLEECTVVDMLPSTFIPTCSQCSTAYPAPGIVSVRGETTSNVCRECHHRFTFKIPQVKFLRISSSDRLPPSSGPRRKKETLGLTPGTELPRRGRCRHYSKSYRWFRFSCCQKVYACDKCHDEAEDHPQEWANRMICGWCSREGNYRPEDCGFCHQSLVRKSGGGGFWEGGKGTRDRIRMSRKDKRKFRRPGGAAGKV